MPIYKVWSEDQDHHFGSEFEAASHTEAAEAYANEDVDGAGEYWGGGADLLVMSEDGTVTLVTVEAVTQHISWEKPLPQGVKISLMKDGFSWQYEGGRSGPFATFKEALEVLTKKSEGAAVGASNGAVATGSASEVPLPLDQAVQLLLGQNGIEYIALVRRGPFGANLSIHADGRYRILRASVNGARDETERDVMLYDEFVRLIEGLPRGV